MADVSTVGVSPVLILFAGDDVAVAIKPLKAGETITLPDGGSLTLATDIPRSHKLALHDLAQGAPVHKYGQIIGVTTVPVLAGSHIHSHNLVFSDDESSRSYDFSSAQTVTDLAAFGISPDDPRPTFQGYQRANGRVGTRNYIAILCSVNCSATAARKIAAHFTPEVMAQYPNVDGVVPLTHTSGCGLVPSSLGGHVLLRTLRGTAANPNVGGVLVLGLGCEMCTVDQLDCQFAQHVPIEQPALNLSDMVPHAQAPTGIHRVPEDESPMPDLPVDTHVETLVLQTVGGMRATVEAGIEAVHRLLAKVNENGRVPCDVSNLVLAQNCGGSDGYSGITANPALGWASDLLVAYSGTSVLAETPEVYGAEHLLTRRAVSQEVGEKLIRQIKWWKRYMAEGEGSMDNNPSPGNKAGGLTTILEKSLGAIAKCGHANLSQVYEYAEDVEPHIGLAFMDTPGYDPVSVTGLVAGGCNIVVFTTGRGSFNGSAIAPCIKVASNTEMYNNLHEDMDLNAGRIVDGTAALPQVGRELFDMMLEAASGRMITASERNDVGIEEFIPWMIGAVT